VIRLHCGPLAAWASSWLSGSAAFDDVLSAASARAPAPQLAGIPKVPNSPSTPSSHQQLGAAAPAPASGPDGRATPLGEILIAWRRANADVRLSIPVPGDVRGLAGPAQFRAAALEAGQAVSGGGIGAVPTLIDHRPSSAPPTLVWRRFDVEEAPVDFVAVADAQYELTEAIRECATALAATTRPASADVGGELAAARRAGERINLPAGFPPRAVALIAQAERMAAVLSLAGLSSPGSTPGSSPGSTLSGPLAPLVIAVRRARLAGYNARPE
jgi:hypothetical protein